MAEVVQKSEDTRDVLAAEQAKAGGAYDYTPEGKKIVLQLPRPVRLHFRAQAVWNRQQF